jgi:hypothetical protein
MKPHMTLKTSTVLTVLTLLLLPHLATAQGNLVVNGGFDTDISGWILTNGASYNSLFGNPVGSVALYNPGSTDASTASQEINSLTPGILYAVSGDYMRGAISGVTDSGFGVALDGVYLFETTALTNYNWYNFIFDYTATSTSALLSLSTLIGEKGNGYTIDNIAMYAVPEPSSLCLIGLGGILSAMLFRKRRNG